MELNDGMECWNGMLEWNAGMEWWNRTTLTGESSTSLSITIGLLDVPSPFDNITLQVVPSTAQPL